MPELRHFQQIGAKWLESMPRAALLDEAGLGKSAQLLTAARGKTLVVAPAMILDAGVWDREHQLWNPDLDLTTVPYSSLCERVAECPADIDGKGNGHQVRPDDVLVLKGKVPTGRQLKNGQPQLKSISRTVCPICWEGYDDAAELPEDPQHWKLVYKTLERPKLEYLRTHWDTIIFDEAQYLKGRKTSWSVAGRMLCKRDPSYVWLATGTAIPNWAYELFVPLQILRPQDASPGQYLGAFYRWAESWFIHGVQRGAGGKVVSEHKLEPRLIACTDVCDQLRWDEDCEHWAEFRRQNLYGPGGEQLFLGRLRNEVLTDLPPLFGWEDDDKHPILFKVKPTEEQARVYAELKKEYVAWCDDETEIAAWSSAALQERLRMVSTGLATADRSQLPHYWKGSGKLVALREILQARGRVPTLVAAHFQNTLDGIAAVCRDLGLAAAEISGRTPDKDYRRRTVDAFQRGDLPVLIGSIETIAEGLTLTAADLFVLLETSYRPDRNQQVARRLHRLGQTRPVTAIRMVTEGTIDEAIQELLISKSIHQLKAMPPREIAKLL